MSTYRAKHHFSGKDEGILSFKKGDVFTLVDVTGNGWLNVKNSEGTEGLAPESYLELVAEEAKKDEPKEIWYVALFDYKAGDDRQMTIKKGEELLFIEKVTKEWWKMKNASGETGLVAGLYLELKPEKKSPDELAEVLKSIDTAIEKINKESVGGFLTSQQQATLKALEDHRKEVLKQGGVSEPATSGNSSTSGDSSAGNDSSMGKAGSKTKGNRRKPPRPPSSNNHHQSDDITSLDLVGVKKREKGSSSSSSRPKSEMIPARSAPSPPTRFDSLKRLKKVEEEKDGPDKTKDNAKESTDESKDKPKTVGDDGISPNTRRRVDTYLTTTCQPLNTDSGMSTVLDNLASMEQRQRSATSPHGTDTSPHRTARSSAQHSTSSTQNSTSSTQPVTSLPFKLVASQSTTPVEEKKLPTEFEPDMAAEIIDLVRNRTGVSHKKSALAVEGVLQFLQEKVTPIAPVMEGLLVALHKSQMDNATDTQAGKETNQDLEKFKEIFFEIREARDDSQQRGWAIRDDSQDLTEYFEDLLQMLYDCDPAISRSAIQEDKYENILVLISYYQLEPRVPLRILLLKIFGAMCTLDSTVISVLLQSVLPNELGHDIHNNLSETYKVVMSSTVCTMMFSTAEEVPLSVYDQFNAEFVGFLFDNIEEPPENDYEEEIPENFLNMLLSFNQHFEYPSTNTVMQVLKDKPNPRVFSERLMLLVNRGEDPVCIESPVCPDSLTKILLDIFSDSSTANLFYTTDLMVLIDIITRQLTDLSPGEKLRYHYIELLHRLVKSTNYVEHKHRSEDLGACLQRITREEEEESRPDQEAVKRLWSEFPGLFDKEEHAS